MTGFKWFLVVVVIGYGGLLALMYVFQRKLMYFPDATRTPPAQAGLPQAEEVRLTSSDGEKLIAWHVAPRGAKPVVIYFQGNGGALDLRVGRFHWLIEDGTGLLALSYRGYGGSSGSPSEAGLIRDAVAAYDFAAARYEPARLVLWGELLGTAVAIALAADHKVGGLILDAPFTSAADLGAAAYPFVPVRWLIKDSFRSDRRIARVHAADPGAAWRARPRGADPLRRAVVCARQRAQAHGALSQGTHVDLDDHGAVEEVRKFLAELH